MQAVKCWPLLCATLVFAGCASLPPAVSPSTPELHQQHLDSVAGINSFDLKGRIGVQTEAKGFSGSAQWQHTQDQDNVSLFSPLGSQVAAIKRTTDGVSLTTNDNKHYEATDAETLTEQNLGWRLPMSGLSDWVLGRPNQHLVETSQWDEAGRLIKLKQDGWDIEYSQYITTNTYQLPTRITLRNANRLTLKLIVQQWQVN